VGQGDEVMFTDIKLKSGRSWARVSGPSFFCDKMQIPELYGAMFWEAIARDDVAVVSQHQHVPHVPPL